MTEGLFVKICGITSEADAPRLTESRASASEVMPQIFTNRPSLIVFRRDDR